MKKSGQALFLMLFMLAGSRDSVAADDAGAAPATHKRPGWVHPCTQSFYNTAAWMQKHRAKFGAAGALAGLVHMCRGGSDKTDARHIDCAETIEAILRQNHGFYQIWVIGGYALIK